MGETVAYQDSSPVVRATRRTPKLPYNKPSTRQCLSLRQDFPDYVPPRPYASDDVKMFGMKPMSRKAALKRSLIQLNGPTVQTWVAFDIDRKDAYRAAELAHLPAPNFISVNMNNGHAHMAYLLESPVAKFSDSSMKPQNFLAGIERGLCRRLGADARYTGLLTKNPVSGRWETEWSDQPYKLHDLAAGLSKQDMRPEAMRQYEAGIGRNCSVFDDTRRWAYPAVLSFKAAGGTLEGWIARLTNIAMAHNCVFDSPMSIRECAAIAKSIGKWTWARFSAVAMARRQSFLGKRGNAKRWEDHVKQQPWEGMGISRATYYRRKKAAGASVARSPASSSNLLNSLMI